MCDLVDFQALWVSKGLAASEARKVLLPAVRPTVDREALVGDEHLPTNLAAIALLCTVDLLMLVQLLLLVEAVTTEPAL